MICVHGTWIRIPRAYLRLPPCREICSGIGIVVCIALIWCAAYPWIQPGPDDDSRHSDVSIRYSVPDTIRYTMNPISLLFNRRLKNPVSMRIISTMLGPRPTAIIETNGNRRHIAEGDSISDAVVDSIGRGVVILRKGNEINRLHM